MKLESSFETNTSLYLQWINRHGLDGSTFPDDLARVIQADGESVNKMCLLTTMDRANTLALLKDQSLDVGIPLYHFSLLKCSQFESASWTKISGASGDPVSLLEKARTVNGTGILIFEDFLVQLRDKLIRPHLLDALKDIHSNVNDSGSLFFIFIESPKITSRPPTSIRGEVYPLFNRLNSRLVDLPNEQGLFRRGKMRCVLPFLRAYVNTEGDERPSWESTTWERLGGVIDGYTRFLRADQILDWVYDIIPPDASKEDLAAVINHLLTAWLVPVDEPLNERSHILERRVEAIRIKHAPKTAEKHRIALWSSNTKWGPRRSGIFPDAMRRSIEGLDPVHTPENERAGLTRYLNLGWQINDSGALEFRGTESNWGPSTIIIPRRLHDEPRRLMLGASLQARAVDLQGQSDSPNDRIESASWNPPGKNLHAAFSTLNGWTHEDAIVLAKSASKKLRRWYLLKWHIPIPTVASRVELIDFEQDDGNSKLVRQGTPLVRAFIDLFAIGLDRRESERLGEGWKQKPIDGWLEIGLPKASMPIDAKILEIQRHSLAAFINSEEPNAPISKLFREYLSNDEALKWREIVTFVLEVSTSVSVGDKLATRHGIKGVVSRILDDDHNDLPLVGGRRAEIVFSPVGIARRGAMGQFHEAAGTQCGHCAGAAQEEQKRPARASGNDNLSVSASAELPRYGPTFVMRQPQDAVWRCKVRGPEDHSEVRGQRYGEMEFWALMAHGASRIADELLSPSRSTARWMRWEAKVSPSDNHRKLATRALNRFLSVVNAKIEDGRLVCCDSPASFSIPIEKHGDLNYATDLLEDADRFAANGGLGDVELKEPVNVTVRNLIGLPRINKVYVLPPWLRPISQGGEHKLTTAYKALFKALANPFHSRNIAILVERCINLILDTDLGIHAFLRREVLGRRLTRSARAVIVPRPDLRIDQIMIPNHVADKLFKDLPDERKNLVLVNRNPTLHRLGLIALRTVPADSDAPVFGLPLGILKVLGADFDGDQATIVALETKEALVEAERLLPGSKLLRLDQFRDDMPAFPLLQELSVLRKEQELADREESEINQEDWCKEHEKLLNEAIGKDEDGWPPQFLAEYEENNKDFWNGLEESEWLKRAEEKMEYIYSAVRRKGRFGGVLRRELYHQPYVDGDSFWRSVAALQAVTERLVQSTLTTKTGEGAAKFAAKKYFADPNSSDSKESLKDLESKNLSFLFRLSDITDPVGLSIKLLRSEAPLPMRIRKNLSDNASHLLRSTNVPEDHFGLFVERLVDELNKLLRNPNLYDEQCCEHLALSDEVHMLRHQQLTEKTIVQLNRRLLEAAFPEEIVQKPTTLSSDALAKALGKRRAPHGLLKWLASPTTLALLNSLEMPSGAPLSPKSISDPRISWFLF